MKVDEMERRLCLNSRLQFLNSACLPRFFFFPTIFVEQIQFPEVRDIFLWVNNSSAGSTLFGKAGSHGESWLEERHSYWLQSVYHRYLKQTTGVLLLRLQICIDSNEPRFLALRKKVVVGGMCPYFPQISYFLTAFHSPGLACFPVLFPILWASISSLHQKNTATFFACQIWIFIAIYLKW